ncbi:MAG: thymidine kinase, partial [Phycisphaerales bacterium]|nr:thymidine kinase [Phycisphaerales bacterium]
MADSKHKQDSGCVLLICGCMFSGKTERLIDRLERAKRLGIPCKAFKHVRDYRYEIGQLVTHAGHRAEAVPVADAEQIYEAAGDAHIIVIDEAQFFGPDLVKVCRRLADQGREVLVAGL